MKSTNLKIKNENGSSTTGQLLWTFFVAGVLIVLGFYHSMNFTQRVNSSSLSDSGATATIPQETETSFSRY